MCNNNCNCTCKNTSDNTNYSNNSNLKKLQLAAFAAFLVAAGDLLAFLLAMNDLKSGSNES